MSAWLVCACHPASRRVVVVLLLHLSRRRVPTTPGPVATKTQTPTAIIQEHRFLESAVDGWILSCCRGRDRLFLLAAHTDSIGISIISSSSGLRCRRRRRRRTKFARGGRYGRPSRCVRGYNHMARRQEREESTEALCFARVGMCVRACVISVDMRALPCAPSRRNDQSIAGRLPLRKLAMPCLLQLAARVRGAWDGRGPSHMRAFALTHSLARTNTRQERAPPPPPRGGRSLPSARGLSRARVSSYPPFCYLSPAWLTARTQRRQASMATSLRQPLLGE